MTCQTKSQPGEEIVTEWMPVVQRALDHYGIRGSNRDDMSQSIVCQILEKRYDRIYDSTKSQLSTFIFAMVRKRVYRMTSRSGRDAMKHSQLIGEDEWVMDEGERKVANPIDEVMSNEFWELVSKVRKELDKIPRRRSIVKDGKMMQRSVTDVFDKLVQQYSQVEIAKAMGYSEGTVSIILKKIRNHPAVQKLLFYQKQ